MNCHACGAEIPAAEKIFREDTCAGCGRPLHCCRNCHFFDPAVFHECREPQAEWVGDKGSANFCEYFRPGAAKGGARKPAPEAARRKLDDLFRKKE
jgi:hypothetical protein